MKKITAYIQVIRPVNFILGFLSIYAAGIICSPNAVSSLNVFFAALSGALIGSGGNAINDYFDIEIDKINRPERVLPAGRLVPGEVLLFYFFLNLPAIILAVQINFSALVIAIFSAAVIFLYSFRLKKIILLGNFVVSFFTGLAFVYGALAAGDWKCGIIPGMFALLINFIREVVKDIEDIEGDSAENVLTFPKIYGIDRTKMLILIVTIIFMIATSLPFLFRIYNIEYFVVVMLGVNLPLVYFLKAVFKHEVNYRKMSSLMKICMAIGLLAIYLGNL